MPVRVHLDEHFSPVIAEELRKRGVDATSTFEAGLSGVDDPTQLAFATREKRVLVTCDSDLLVIHHRGIEHCGIVAWQGPADAIGLLVRWLTLLAEVYEAEELINRVEFLP